MSEERPAAVIEPAELDGSARFEELLAKVAAGRPADAGGLWGSSQSWVLGNLMRRVERTWVIVCSKEDEAEIFADDLAAFGIETTVFPARETGTLTAGADMDAVRGRLQVAQRLAGPAERRPPILVTSLLAILQPIPSPQEISADFLHLQLKQKLVTEELLERLVNAGYARTPLAESPGEISMRGDILDVYPFAAELPLRIELWDDEIESLRVFDPGDQRSVDSLTKISLCLASDAGDIETGNGTLPANLFDTDAVWVDVEPLRIADQTEGLRLQSTAHAHAIDALRRARKNKRQLSLQSLPTNDVNFPVKSVQSLAVGMPVIAQTLRGVALDGTRVRVLCKNDAEAHRFRSILGAPDSTGDVSLSGGDSDVCVEISIGSLARGFRYPEPAVVIVNHRELSGIETTERREKAKPAHRAKVLSSFFELRLGDLVVHAVHGLSRYAGLVRMDRNGGEEDHLHLIFKEDVSLFVPASRIDLVQRYVGSGSASPPLDKIGSPSFRRRKEKVGKALIDLAADLLEIQGKRETHTRPAWPKDDDLVRDLIGAFPWTDTADQEVADREITSDITGPRPMDRLLCGDVGFGKTEVALRAAFRVVNGGGQVAVLVPTTVLTSQHEKTFQSRLADFPVTVDSLSRYRTAKAKREVVAKTASGEIDILIGTHRILSKDVSFANLGLVIIDEEQRFGVTHKEHFKKLRATVDVLTLSATPIPRTLHMSLSGVRDISALTIPPAGRQDIETRLVSDDNRQLLREVLLREKNRGGQTFFLHNRVTSIERFKRELQELVPECSYLVGHGQMTGPQLRKIMNGFIRGEADVLVATTIVENGIDIPSAGTIVIDQANMYGLSELHQLRGRVGRGTHKAYCYLLVDKTKPLSDVARKRLKALEEMSSLGAGFSISMRDLEIRGAGNILGPQQSGHILAVGYDMYCRLLKSTVDSMRESGSDTVDPKLIVAAGETELSVELALGLPAFLSSDWIPGGDTRLDLLRSFDSIQTDQDAIETIQMLKDRYGRPPAEALALVRQFRLKATLAQAEINRISWHEEFYAIDFRDRVALESLFTGRRVELRPIRTGRVHLHLPRRCKTAAQSLTWLEEQLNSSHASTSSAANAIL
ncbi:MAG: transcription-repair coupling factor (superfamily II helicase) [Planctomycetota bacterium]